MAISPDLAAGTVDVLRALADPTRLQIVACLAAAADPVCVCDFTAAFGLSQPTVSHHMARLRAAGLVESGRRGVWAHYRLREDLSPAVRRLLEAATADSP
jgi:ArsR family transcriptional regulator